MNTKVKFFGMATLLFAVTACSSDELEMVNQGPEITFNTSVSRATETTTLRNSLSTDTARVTTKCSLTD